MLCYSKSRSSHGLFRGIIAEKEPRFFGPQEGRLLPLPSLAGGSDDEPNAGPHVLRQRVPEVDHDQEVGGWARKIAADCAPVCATRFSKGYFFRVIQKSCEPCLGSFSILKRNCPLFGSPTIRVPRASRLFLLTGVRKRPYRETRLLTTRALSVKRPRQDPASERGGWV